MTATACGLAMTKLARHCDCRGPKGPRNDSSEAIFFAPASLEGPNRYQVSSRNLKGHAMRPIHDIDALILMATTISSKRRPAELVEIVAAAELIQGTIPYVEKLGDAIQRLSALGLIGATEGRFTLTPIGREIMAKQPKKAVTEELIIAIKSNLAAYSPIEEYPPILLTNEQLGAAIRAHKIARKTSGKNLLMPKPKVDRHFKVEGRWRRAPATR